MKPFTISKNVRHGDVCAFRGNKLIHASRRTKNIAGVWVRGDTTIIYTTAGVKYEQTTPTGLQTHGGSRVNVYIR